MDFSICPVKREFVIEGFNSIYYFEFGKDFFHPPEKHDFWEFVYVDGGEVVAITDGLGSTLSQGQVIFHKPGEIHAHVSDKKVPNNMLVVSFTASGKAMELFEKKVYTLDKTGKTLLSLFMNEAKNALGEIPSEYGNKNALDFSSAPSGSMQLLECYLTEFLIVLNRLEETKDVFSREESRQLAQSSITELVCDYLINGVYENLTLHDVCSKFYVGKSNLCKLFCDYVGKGPMEYYNEIKMAEAKKLLLQGDMSVSTISDKLGYSSIHNFSRAFKKNFGVAPTEYKRKINKL